MAGIRNGLTMASQLMKTLTGSSNSRSLSSIVGSEITTSHTQKWMQWLLEVLAKRALPKLARIEHGRIVITLPKITKNPVTSLKLMEDTSKKSPMDLINEVPPIKVHDRIVACEGDNDPALGHPIEFICLDKAEPAVCKYCGLRYEQDHHH